mmetsp:Transcript_10757/g.43361  ORF Transcript_10757/g.43361 Transcript_10757/m.43361 type:complete len:201 (-) Transcript_10757:444-1046(-)
MGWTSWSPARVLSVRFGCARRTASVSRSCAGPRTRVWVWMRVWETPKGQRGASPASTASTVRIPRGAYRSTHTPRSTGVWSPPRSRPPTSSSAQTANASIPSCPGTRSASSCPRACTSRVASRSRRLRGNRKVAGSNPAFVPCSIPAWRFASSGGTDRGWWSRAAPRLGTPSDAGVRCLRSCADARWTRCRRGRSAYAKS